MISLFLTFLLSSAIAVPLPVVDIPARDVFVPPVLTPNADCIWKIGTTQTVTWSVQADENLMFYVLIRFFLSRDVSHPPERITNTKATIILVKDKRLDMGTFGHYNSYDGSLVLFYRSSSDNWYRCPRRSSRRRGA